MNELRYLRIATISFDISVADVDYNTNQIMHYIKKCADNNVGIAIFQSMALCGVTCGDLSYDGFFLSKIEDALIKVQEYIKDYDVTAIFGLPILKNGRIHSSVAIVNKNGLYVAGKNSENTNNINFILNSKNINNEYQNLKIKIEIADKDTGNNLRYHNDDEGYDITLILSAITSIATDDKLSTLKTLSKINKCAYAFVGASKMESTTDYVFSSEMYIVEDGELLADNSKNFNMIIADIDLGILRAEKSNILPFKDYLFIGDESFEIFSSYKYLELSKTNRKYRQNPFLSDDIDLKNKYLSKIIKLQENALNVRLKKIDVKKVILGMSGGLDSTCALMSIFYAFKNMNYDLKNIIAVMMPCFGSGKRTKNNALNLCENLKISHITIDIQNTVKMHFQDIGHNIDNHNSTFENAQARYRMQVLMDMANDENALVIGTCDMSEIALGFSTYNGDHMGMYGLNNSLPKSVLRQLVRYMADDRRNVGDDATADILEDIYSTPISPELLPSCDNEMVQKTEEIIGPYQLHDFYLYYFLKYKYSPKMIFDLACNSFCDKYRPKDILKYMKIFYQRFFAAQFKRSCSYDAPMLLDLSLSPRGGFNMPSDATAAMWIRQIDEIIKDYEN